MKEKAALHCIYDGSSASEGAVGRLLIYFPTEGGYVVHSVAHTVRPDRNADVWRLSEVFFQDEDGKKTALTSLGAEWDMAIMLVGRPDFIGGYAHGDEISAPPSLFIDEEKTSIEALAEPTEFSELRLSLSSDGYDPSSPEQRVLSHEKEYVITKDGISLTQSVFWLGEYPISRGFLAMLPPKKEFTSYYYTDKNKTPQPIECPTSIEGISSVTLLGEEGFSFTMSVDKECALTLADNGTSAYNKAYFSYKRGGNTQKGEVWRAKTNYQITRTIKVQNL